MLGIITDFFLGQSKTKRKSSKKSKVAFIILLAIFTFGLAYWVNQ